jgi:aminoglycoside phosphotransferase (APT) family kinase protein
VFSRQRDLDAVRARLTGWLAARLPHARDVAVSSLRAPEAGFSNESLLFDLTYDADGRRHVEPLVVRLTPDEFHVFPEYDLARQFHVMRALAATDVPVPRVRWLEEDAAVVGSPFFVMDRIAGDIPCEVPPYHVTGFFFDATPARRTRMWWSGIETLARLHALDWRTLGVDFLGVPGDGTDALDRQLDYYARYLAWARGAEPQPIRQPILQAALEWLRAHRYVPSRVSLCWGDSRLPNVIFRDDAVAAILDWEMAFLGDPEADLGWWLFMDWHHGEGSGNARLPGVPTRDETIARYRALTGLPATHVLWNEVFAALRFGAILVKVTANLAAAGIPLAGPGFATDNACTRRLAALLDLPPSAAGG